MLTIFNGFEICKKVSYIENNASHNQDISILFLCLLGYDIKKIMIFLFSNLTI